jgi:hypothetical protein
VAAASTAIGRSVSGWPHRGRTPAWALT